MCGTAGSGGRGEKSKRRTSVTSKPAASIAASVSRAAWQPPASRGHSVLRSPSDEDGAQRLALGVDVLEEAQLAAGAQHAAQLGQRGRLVGHAAQHEAGDRRVAAAVLER